MRESDDWSSRHSLSEELLLSMLHHKQSNAGTVKPSDGSDTHDMHMTSKELTKGPDNTELQHQKRHGEVDAKTIMNTNIFEVHLNPMRGSLGIT